jgi:hypothetical protein
VSDKVDFVREVDVRIENAQSVVVVVAHLHVLENVMAEVRLNSRLECVGPVIQKTSSFNLREMQTIQCNMLELIHLKKTSYFLTDNNNRLL